MNFQLVRAFHASRAHKMGTNTHINVHKWRMCRVLYAVLTVVCCRPDLWCTTRHRCTPTKFKNNFLCLLSFPLSVSSQSPLYTLWSIPTLAGLPVLLVVGTDGQWCPIADQWHHWSLASQWRSFAIRYAFPKTQIYCFHFICFGPHFSFTVLPFDCESHFIDGYGYWNDEPVMRQWMCSTARWLCLWWAVEPNAKWHYILCIIYYYMSSYYYTHKRSQKSASLMYELWEWHSILSFLSLVVWGDTNWQRAANRQIGSNARWEPPCSLLTWGWLSLVCTRRNKMRKKASTVAVMHTVRDVCQCCMS